MEPAGAAPTQADAAGCPARRPGRGGGGEQSMKGGGLGRLHRGEAEPLTPSSPTPHPPKQKGHTRALLSSPGTRPASALLSGPTPPAQHRVDERSQPGDRCGSACPGRFPWGNLSRGPRAQQHTGSCAAGRPAKACHAAPRDAASARLSPCPAELLLRNPWRVSSPWPSSMPAFLSPRLRSQRSQRTGRSTGVAATSLGVTSDVHGACSAPARAPWHSR